MVFNVKMEHFCWKVQLVAGGHMTDVPPTVMYASVALHETVQIALTTAALNGLKVMAADIMNAYITVPNKEKIWMLLDPEFGKEKGCKGIVVRAFYGLNTDLWMKACVQDTRSGPEKYSHICSYM